MHHYELTGLESATAAVIETLHLHDGSASSRHYLSSAIATLKGSSRSDLHGMNKTEAAAVFILDDVDIDIAVNIHVARGDQDVAHLGRE